MTYERVLPFVFVLSVPIPWAAAQSERRVSDELKVGEKVVVTKAVNVVAEPSKIKRHLPEGTSLVVTELRGNFVRGQLTVDGRQESVWLMKSEVQPASEGRGTESPNKAGIPPSPTMTPKKSTVKEPSPTTTDDTACIQLLKAEWIDTRTATEVTSAGWTTTTVHPSNGQRFLVLTYSLTPPAPLPALPAEAIAAFQQPPPESPEAPAVVAKTIRELRQKYPQEFQDRIEAADRLVPTLVASNGDRLRPANKAGVGSWSVNEVTGSKGFFVWEDEAVFEAPKEHTTFTLQVAGYEPFEIDAKNLTSDEQD